MTFKHVKFADSPTMRALEKVAYDKGWVKPEPLVRTASAKAPNLAPTDNLMTNVLKLCAGLRGTQGMEKYADELETCYLNYKSAQTMYDAHGEKGEDVIHAAHPKGSHKLEDVDSSEACFEDILDRHVKMLQVVEKKPTGKLSSAKQVIDSVKTALGQISGDRKAQLQSIIEGDVEKIKARMNRVMEEAGPHLLSIGPFEDVLKSSTTNAMEPGKLSDLQQAIKTIKQRVKPGGGGLTGVTQDTWDMISIWLEQSEVLVAHALTARREYNSIVRQERSHMDDPVSELTPTAPASNGAAQQLSSLYNEITQSIAQAKTKVQALPNAAITAAWFDKAQQYAKTAFETEFAQASKDPAIAQQLLSKLTEIKAKVDRAQQKLSA